MSDLTRRDALVAAGAGAAALAAAPALAQPVAPRAVPAFAGQHQPRPLKFDPGKLPGLSEKLVRSHWENNYQGSVRRSTWSSCGWPRRWRTRISRR